MKHKRMVEILRTLKQLDELDNSTLANSSNIDDQELYLKLSRRYQQNLEVTNV